MGKPITYADAGVDIAAGEAAVAAIKDAVTRTHGPNVLAGVGAFGGAYLLPNTDLVLVQSIDGVGTKIQLAISAGDCTSVGADLVNHCANDVIAQGARPITFLDYFAAAKLNPDHMAQAVTGAAQACEVLNMALMGGETAEMPDFYIPGIFDLAGCITGIAQQGQIITGENIRPGDCIIGLPSDGLHTNGYSLARRCLEKAGLSVHDIAPWNPATTVGESLLRVHKNYLGALDVVRRHSVTGIAHITGGGIPGNLIRVLPDRCKAIVDTSTWSREPLFDWLQRISMNDYPEMFHTFNMGLGMVLVCNVAQCPHILEGLDEFDARIVGKIIEGDRDVVMIC